MSTIDNILNINADIKGIIRELNITPSNVLYPFYEGVVNSIQAIEEREDQSKNNGLIRVYIERDLTQQSLFEELADYPIKEIRIEDNGVGFNEENLKSFKTAHSTKKSKLGGKGLGRFAMLSVFSKISVSSVFVDKEDKHKKITFSLTRNGISKPEITSTEKGCGTTVILEDIDQKFQKATAKYNHEAISDGILKHCLLYYLNEDAPKIEIYERNMVINLKNQFSPSDYIYYKVHNKIVDTNFYWFFVKNDKGAYHELVLSANNRRVKSKRIEKILPLFSSPIQHNGEDVYFTIYVVSEYLDEKVNISRTGFDFPKPSEEGEQQNKFEFETLRSIVEKDIDNNAIQIIRETFPDEISVRTAETRTKVNHFLNTDYGVGYRHLNLTDDFLASVPNDADDKKLDDLFHEYQFQCSKENRKNKEKLFKTEFSDRPEYKELLDAVIKSATDEGISKLAQYVAHRRTIIELLEKYLGWCDENQNYEEESVLHNLIYTMGGTDEAISYDKHNLWLLDDRLAFHRYIYSDKSIKSHIPADGSESRKETDIAIYDIHFAYGEHNEYGLVNSVVLFELKRPDRKVTYEEFSKQMRDQIRGVKDGKVKDSRGMGIHTNESTPVFFYYVCDVEAYEKLKISALDEGFRETPYKSLLRMNTNNTVQEVLTYQTILINAKRRNMIFFDKLGIK